MVDARQGAKPRLARSGRGELSHAVAKEFPASADELASVREFLRAAVAAQDLGEPAVGEFVVTELAANSIIHARSQFRVRVGFTANCLRIEVTDASDDPPLLGRSLPAVHGLEMVDRLVNDWGYTMLEGGGKTVWADVALRSAA